MHSATTATLMLSAFEILLQAAAGEPSILCSHLLQMHGPPKFCKSSSAIPGFFCSRIISTSTWVTNTPCKSQAARGSTFGAPTFTGPGAYENLPQVAILHLVYHCGCALLTTYVVGAAWYISLGLHEPNTTNDDTICTLHLDFTWPGAGLSLHFI